MVLNLSLAQTHQPGLPGVLTLLKEVDAIVINTHRCLDYPLHLPPHVHYIGCVLCREGRPLPQTLQNWVGTVAMSLSDECHVDAIGVGIFVLSLDREVLSRCKVLSEASSGIIKTCGAVEKTLSIEWFKERAKYRTRFLC